MPDFFKSIKITQPTPGGPLVESVVGAVQVSTGTAADAGKLVVLNATGLIDSSMISGSSAVSVNGSPVSNPNFQDGDIKFHVSGSNITETVHALATTGASVVIDSSAPPTTGQALVATSPTVASWQTVATSENFGAITSGTNTIATMTVGSGASIVVTGTGVVESTELATNTATPVQINLSAPAHQGQLLISQPGNATALWADPFVQGPWVNGTSIVAPGAMGDGTSNIQPVFVAGYDGTNMRGLLTSNTGQLHVIADSGSTTVVTGTVAVTQSTSPWVVSLASTTITGTVAVTQSTSPWLVAGTLTHNNAAPVANNVGVLPAVASSAAPVYNAGDQVLLSTDLSGALRVSSGGSFTPALTADRTATGTITSTQNVSVSSAGGGTLVFNITGTWTGTIVFEASVDGVNWVTADAVPYQGAIPNGNIVSSATANGQWSLGIGGINSFRLRGNTVATGTATVWLEVGAGSNAILISDIVQGSISINNTVTVTGSVTVGGSVTANQGSAALVSGSWPVEVTDGTNILLTTAHPGNINISQVGGSAVQTATSGIMKIGVTDAAGTSILSTVDTGPVTGLNVHVTNTGGLAGTQYLEGTTVATPTGTAAMGKNPSNLIETLRLDASNNLLVDLNTAIPTGTNTIGSVKVTDGTNVLFTSAHPGITEDLSDGTVNTSSQPSTAIQVAGWDGSNLRVLSTTSNGFLNTNATVSGSFTPALTSDRTATGTITASSQSVAISTQGGFSLIVNVTGTWSGTLQPQFLMPDGSTWVAGSVYPTLPGGTPVSSITANGQWTIPVGGIQSFRLFSTAWTSGTATVSEEVGAGGYSVAVHQGTAANLNATVTQGTTHWDTNVTQVSGSSVTLGQKTSANSFPVVIASDQSSINVVNQAGNNNIGNVGYTLPTAERLSFAAINFSSSGTNTVIAGVGGQTIRVFRLIFNVGGSTAISFSDGTTTFSGPLTFTTSGGMVLDLSGEPWYVTGLGNGFIFNSTGAVQVGGTIWYTQS